MEGKVHMTSEPREEPPGEEASSYARRMTQESSVSYMDCLFSVLAGSEQTEGRFGLIEMVAPKGREPSRHLHHTDDEGFYVLEGELTFYVGERTYAAGPGTFAFLPHGVAHSYTFETDVVRMLSIIAPGGLERHFLDPRFSEPAKGMTLLPPAEAPDPELLEAMSKDLTSYGTEVVGPPGPPRQVQ
jgi:quercetin dioxygenase-like cupin family protein